MAATRLPGKVLLPLAGAPMLERLVERVARSRTVDEIVIATTVGPPDAAIAALGERIGCRVHRGSIEDITERLLGAAEGHEIVVQLTADCPLIDPAHIDQTVDLLRESGADYAGNSLGGCSFPLGFDVRVFTLRALRRSAALTHDPIDRAHGSYFIYRHPHLFRLVGWAAEGDMRWPELRLTVDEPADYELVRRVFDTLYPLRRDFDARDVVSLLRARPDWTELNRSVRQKAASEG